MLGIFWIEPVRSGDHQEAAVLGMLGDDFGRQRHAGGKWSGEIGNPRDVENTRVFAPLRTST